MTDSKFKSRKNFKRKKKSKTSNKLRWIFFLFIIISLFGTGFYYKQKIFFYYTQIFEKAFKHKKLKNSKEEQKRIDRIIGLYANQTFGFDISHYQRKEDIKWDSLSIGNKTIPLKFVILRASMGNNRTDKNFNHFWEAAKEHNLIRGAYHFYSPDEDPVKQANSYLNVVTLESGDLPPILDIEKMPKNKSKQQLIDDLKTWLKIMEDKYDKKPIIYTYYHFFNDYLKDDFSNYTIWMANYNNVEKPSTTHNWAIWQFTEQGIVYGINTKVDLNVYNGNLWSLKLMTLK